MSTVAAIGETHELEGFALVGVTVIATTTPDQVIDAWRNLDPNVSLVILSPAANKTLHPMLADRSDTLTVAMP
jgi:vacuolar-type H+-ATPase subunit F/Vma7